jgi:hypothetical protein
MRISHGVVARFFVAGFDGTVIPVLRGFGMEALLP